MKIYDIIGGGGDGSSSTSSHAGISRYSGSSSTSGYGGFSGSNGTSGYNGYMNDIPRLVKPDNSLTNRKTWWQKFIIWLKGRKKRKLRWTKVC